MSFGTLPSGAELRWNTKQPGDVLDYTYDATDDLTDCLTCVADLVQSVAISVRPSGTGELLPLAIAVSGSLIVVRLAGGVPGRNYIVRIAAAGASGQTYEFNIGLLINPLLAAAWPLLPPPSTGYGTATVWLAGSGLQDSSGNFMTDSSGNPIF